MSRHAHSYNAVRLALYAPAGGQPSRRMLHLVCGGCRRVHPIPVAHHEWERPGRPLAHGRPVRCACCAIELVELRHQCATHGRGPHGVRVRDRGGLALTCRACAREEVGAREIPAEVSRRASVDYQRRLRAARRAGVAS